MKGKLEVQVIEVPHSSCSRTQVPSGHSLKPSLAHFLNSGQFAIDETHCPSSHFTGYEKGQFEIVGHDS